MLYCPCKHLIFSKCCLTISPLYYLQDLRIKQGQLKGVGMSSLLIFCSDETNGKLKLFWHWMGLAYYFEAKSFTAIFKL